MTSDDYHDVRLVYLAISHIMKNRGHFLFPGENLKAALDLSSALNEMRETFQNIYDSELSVPDHSYLCNSGFQKVVDVDYTDRFMAFVNYGKSCD